MTRSPHLPGMMQLAIGREGARQFADAVTNVETGRQLLVSRLGAENVTRLVGIVGGTQITVPTNLTSSKFNAGRLRGRLGDALFALLVFHFGGDRLYVPQAGATTNAPVDIRAVARLTRRGWSASRIARKLGCSERTVFAKRALLRSRARINDPRAGTIGVKNHD